MTLKNIGSFYIILFGFILSCFFIFTPFFKANAQQPAVSFSAVPNVIKKGESSSLSWRATNSMYCVASGGWSGNKLLFGSQNVFPEKTTNYNINCVGVDGITSAFKSVTVTVLEETSPAPVSNPISIERFRSGCAASPNPARINEEVVFIASQTGGNLPVSYQWSGDVVGKNSPIKTSFSTTGVKTANLLAIDSFGRRAETTCSIQVISAAPPSPSASQSSLAKKAENKKPVKTDLQTAAVGGKQSKSLLILFLLIASILANLSLLAFIILLRKKKEEEARKWMAQGDNEVNEEPEII